MRILITNDDSISSSVLLPLIQWAKQFGEVTTVVPKYEQSGKSHSIELHKAFEIKKVSLSDEIEVYTVDSSPADCVRFAVSNLNETYDLVISGINRGFNVGIDMLYSGTVGAIFEASCFHIPAIALSTATDTFDDALQQLDTVWNFFLEHKLLEKHSLYNVNIPLAPKGIRIAEQGGRLYSDDFVPIGNDMYEPRGKFVFEPSNDSDTLLDTDAVLRHNYISISPLTLSRMEKNVFDTLKELNP